jgi:hypothetical protein
MVLAFSEIGRPSSDRCHLACLRSRGRPHSHLDFSAHWVGASADGLPRKPCSGACSLGICPRLFFATRYYADRLSETSRGAGFSECEPGGCFRLSPVAGQPGEPSNTHTGRCSVGEGSPEGPHSLGSIPLRRHKSLRTSRLAEQTRNKGGAVNRRRRLGSIHRPVETRRPLRCSALVGSRALEWCRPTHDR